nr:hypothetical protein [Tanacetum cinerariifolium]
MAEAMELVVAMYKDSSRGQERRNCMKNKEEENGIDPPFVAWQREAVTQNEPCDETRTFTMARLIRAKAYQGA